MTLRRAARQATLAGRTTCRAISSTTARALPGRSSGLSVLHSTSAFYGAFVWARRALSIPERRLSGPGSAPRQVRVQLRLRELPARPPLRHLPREGDNPYPPPPSTMRGTGCIANPLDRCSAPSANKMGTSDLYRGGAAPSHGRCGHFHALSPPVGFVWRIANGIHRGA
jgi:hypothetical protein